MFLDLDDLDGITVTADRAYRAVTVDHQLPAASWDEFAAEHGDADEYDAADLYGWLGH